MEKMFKSDNNSGAHDLILQAMIEVNKGHTYPYGGDQYTEKAKMDFVKTFGEETQVFFVLNGTAANVIGLSSMIASYEGVLCTDTAHINVDECGAFEKFTGSKLLQVPNKNGKLDLETLSFYMEGIGDEHRVQPKVISISQLTEMGTCYTLEEIRQIADFAHKHQMYLHMDGARLANAAVLLGVSFLEMTFMQGVDILSFGGTKNGMLFGEAIVTKNKELSQKLLFLRKQGMHLLSKMRYVSAQFSAYLKDSLWKQNAEHANQMGQRLREGLERLPGVEMKEQLLGNMLFLKIPRTWNEPLFSLSPFYVIEEKENLIRLVTSFDTTEEEVERFLEAARELAERR